MTSKSFGARWSPPQPPPPPPPPPRPPNRTIGCGEPEAKRGKAARTCSLCKVSKSLHDGFSKNQRGKGADAKCKECIEGHQKLQAGKNAQKRKGREDRAAETRKKQEENQRLAAERRKAKEKKQEEIRIRADERRKVKEEEQRQRAIKRKQEEEERRRAAELQEEEEMRVLLAENEGKEARHYKKIKDEHARHVKWMKNLGRDIEKEMAASSNLVYVVTSICKRVEGCPSAAVQLGGLLRSQPKTPSFKSFSPHLHGIYTTCKEAGECARRVFEALSRSYRDGAFVPNKERIAKCDTMCFLAPGVQFDARVMFEVFRKSIKADYSWVRPTPIYDFTAVAINALPIDADDVLHQLPFLEKSLGHVPDDQKEEDMSRDCGEPLSKGAEVFAVFGHKPGHDNEEDVFDVSLCGVFRNREDATRRAVEERKNILREQREAFPRVNNGIHFYKMLQENCCAVAIESVALDQGTDMGKKLEFGTKDGACIWVNPDIEWY